MKRDARAPRPEQVHRLTLDSRVLEGQSAGRSGHAHHRRLRTGGDKTGRAAAACRSRRLHRGRTGAHQLEEFRRECARAAGSPDRPAAPCRPRSSRFPTVSPSWAATSTSTAPRTGRWDDFLLRRSVPFVERRFRLRRRRAARRASAKAPAATAPSRMRCSSRFLERRGLSFRRHGVRAGVTCREFPRLLRALAKHGGSIEKWIDDFYAAPKVKDSDVHNLMTLAMCATYDPDPGAPYRLAPAGTIRHLRNHPRALGQFHATGIRA